VAKADGSGHQRHHPGVPEPQGWGVLALGRDRGPGHLRRIWWRG
jgi:hypothetical protein